MEKRLAEKIDAFFTQFKHIRCKKGEILIRAEEDPPSIFYLKEGNVRQYIISRKGDEVVVNIFRPISFFPMSWAMNATQNIYFFETMTETKLWKAPKAQVVSFVKSEPEILYDLLKRVYVGTDGVLLRMAYLMSGSAHERLITELLILAKRFGIKNGSKIDLKISEKDLAMQTGMTRETVSREMRYLKQKHLVTFDKNILTIYHFESLQDALMSS